MVEPFDRRVIEVCGGHQIHIEQSGNPDGVPVIVLHGGPGGGCSPYMRRFFDPAHYRAILFDQRGCGRSRPHAEVQANTTAHLIADIELIRQHFGIGRAILFGGSWGATLALAYAQTCPEAVESLILRGVFLGRRSELDWFYGGGAARFFPDRWAEFLAPIPEAERGDMIAAYHRRLFCGNLSEETRFGRAWAQWENALASISNEGSFGESPAEYARAFARLENHYFVNGGFLESDGWILQQRRRIAHIPAVIVQGRYDMVCPPQSAWDLAHGWAGCQLQMVGMAGHALSEPGISEALVRAMNVLR